MNPKQKAINNLYEALELAVNELGVVMTAKIVREKLQDEEVTMEEASELDVNFDEEIL